MRALQQLTCMVGKDEYKEKSWSGDVNLVSIMIHLVVCLLSLCRLSIGNVLEVLTSVFCTGRELVGDWRAGPSPRSRVASFPVPGWQSPQAMMKVQVLNGPDYERLVNQKVLRFAKDSTS